MEILQISGTDRISLNNVIKGILDLKKNGKVVLVEDEGKIFILPADLNNKINDIKY